MSKGGFVDKTRTGIPGAGSKLSRVVNKDAWGADAAVKRGYCSGTEVTPGPAKGAGPQHPQSREDQHGARYDNSVRDGWMRGGGGAETRPGYVAGYRSPSHAGVGRDGGETGDQAVGHYDPKPMRQGPNAIRGKSNR